MIVFIPTAGLGERLKDKTKYLNKSLLDLNNKPIISHIIEKFPLNTKFVIALGYKGNIVKEYMNIAHKNRNIKFVNVRPFEGKKSGLGLTLLKSSKFLQNPFLFISCDALIKKFNISQNYNWVGYSNKSAGTNYRSLDIKKKKLLKINEKSKKFKNKKTYIGVAFIKDYKFFWKETKKNFNNSINQGEVLAINKLIKSKSVFCKKLMWDDTGSTDNYEKIKKKYSKKNDHNILNKSNETIWFINNLVIKFSSDKNFIKKRAKRSLLLKNFVPKLVNIEKNMYAYKYIKGNVFSKNLSLKKFKILLSFLKKFWKINKPRNNIKFRSDCIKFYKDKTRLRIKMLHKRYKLNDTINTINNKKIPSISTLFKKTDWQKLSNGISSRFHGDLHFENIIMNNDKKITLLDWRQEFEKNLDKGDLYYDLGKLMHGLIVDHNQINANNFQIKINKNNVFLKIRRKKSHKICLKYFEKWLIENNFDLIKVRIITALIFLNIAPLHHHPYSLFLYFLGKKMLEKNTQ